MPDSRARFHKRRVKQPPLPFSETMPLLHTVVITRKRDFENLFDGFTKLWAISYVVSPDLLLEFFDQYGYTGVEVIVGENMSASYRQSLEKKGIEVAERLAELVELGALRIYLPKRTIHTKLYILENAESVRVIMSSANFTETAREASRQINYAWYADFQGNDPLLDQVRQDYESHRKGCSLFMSDLKELLQTRQDLHRPQLIEAWLKGQAPDAEDLETKRVLQEISAIALHPTDVTEEPVIAVRLPDAPSVQRQIDKLLAPLGSSRIRNELQLNRPDYIRWVQETYHFPLLSVDLERQELRLGLNGSITSLTEALPDRALVNQALQHIEDYLNTVDLGQTTDPKFVKTSMFEALLYLFFAPFANEHMRIRRSKYAAIERRGPRFLYIYGPSQNGKSTFLRFALKLLAGDVMEALRSTDFTAERLHTANSLGTAFPLVFDDFVPSRRSKTFEDVVKSYWETWRNEDYVSPQIILSSNDSRLKDWAKSRVKRVDFDVQFAPDQRSRDSLAEVFSVHNPLFRWFSFLYLLRLQSPDVVSDDELELSRTVMKELYGHAQRPLPDFFPQQPIESLYDPGRRDWHDVLRLNLAKVSPEKGRIIVTFSTDMQHGEIRNYLGYLPQTVKSQRKGKTIVIETPNQFTEWLYSGPYRRQRSWWNRLLRK